MNKYYKNKASGNIWEYGCYNELEDEHILWNYGTIRPMNLRISGDSLKRNWIKCKSNGEELKLKNLSVDSGFSKEVIKMMQINEQKLSKDKRRKLYDFLRSENIKAAKFERLMWDEKLEVRRDCQNE